VVFTTEARKFIRNFDVAQTRNAKSL
jgi:hypothetical protein